MKIKNTFLLLFSRKFSALLMMLWYKAALLAFYSGSMPRIAIKSMNFPNTPENTVRENRICQFIQLCVSIGNVFGGLFWGRVFTKLRNRINVTISIVIGSSSIIVIIILYSLGYYTYVGWYILGFLFGNSEFTAYTIIIAVLAYEFTSDTEQFGAYAVMRGFGIFFWYLMSSIMVEHYTYALIIMFACLNVGALIVI